MTSTLHIGADVYSNPVMGDGGAPAPFAASYTLFDKTTPDYIDCGEIGNTPFGGLTNEKFILAIVLGKTSQIAANFQIFNSATGPNLRWVVADGKFRALFQGTGNCDLDHNITVAVDTLYGIYLSVDFSLGSTTTTYVINNNTSHVQTAVTTGALSFSDINITFAANATGAAASALDGCLGPIWFMQGTYDAAGYSKFFNADGTPKDWSTEADVTALGTPELFIKNWLNKDGGGEIVNSGSGQNLAIVGGGDPTIGSPVACSI